MTLVHVKGKNKGKVILYALSTCVWCNKTKNGHHPKNGNRKRE